LGAREIYSRNASSLTRCMEARATLRDAPLFI
jgi:hypothetical protein